VNEEANVGTLSRTMNPFLMVCRRGRKYDWDNDIPLLLFTFNVLTSSVLFRSTNPISITNVKLKFLMASGSVLGSALCWLEMHSYVLPTSTAVLWLDYCVADLVEDPTVDRRRCIYDELRICLRDVKERSHLSFPFNKEHSGYLM